ncbi:MAG: hypothetical protein ACKO2V_20075 [Snowella sp.]
MRFIPAIAVSNLVFKSDRIFKEQLTIDNYSRLTINLSAIASIHFNKKSTLSMSKP